MFQIGQRVVCIDDTFQSDPRYKELPKKGIVYTVGGYHPCVQDSIYLKELNNSLPEGQGCFWARRFRPVVEPKVETNISVFQKLLITKKIEENV